jgi:CBS domain-containing protein
MKLADSIRPILQHKGREIWSLPPDASVYQAIAMMSDKKVGALLVMSEGRLVGIVSERDYARKVILQGHSSKHTKIREIMSSPVIQVSPDQSMDDCMRIMTAHRIRHLPVVEADKVVGVVSIGDLVNWIITEQHETIQHLSSYIAGSYPG